MASIVKGWKWTFLCLKAWRVSVSTNEGVGDDFLYTFGYSFLFDSLTLDIDYDLDGIENAIRTLSYAITHPPSRKITLAPPTP